MHEDIIKKLYKTFQLSTRQGQGGITFKYVPNEDVINRMNDTFEGNWSTSVEFRDIVDDQVILEVKVSVVDPATEIRYSHTGFGSQQIMRYKSGANAGQIIDIGNGYKGALSKAIVNACTRWGIGLFKESNPMEDDESIMIESTTVEISPNVVIPPVEMPGRPTPMPVPNTGTPPPSPYIVETTAVPNVIPPPNTASPMPVPPTMVVQPPTFVVPEPVVVENTTTFPPPMAPEMPVSANISLTQELPSIPTPAVNVIPTTPDLPFSKEQGLGSIRISDVQKVALNGILTMNNADYGELALEAFGANGINKPVPNREDLSYEEAVVVIKFGNEKYRKNR